MIFESMLFLLRRKPYKPSKYKTFGIKNETMYSTLGIDAEKMDIIKVMQNIAFIIYSFDGEDIMCIKLLFFPKCLKTIQFLIE